MKKRTINKLSQLSLVSKIDFCKKLDNLITAGNTGGLKDVAQSLDITESLANELLGYMTSEMRCPIEFSDAQDSYVYTRKGRFFAGFLPIP